MIPFDADFGKYKLVVAPVLYMVREGMEEALEKFVENGGILVITYMSGIVGQSDNVHLGGYPGPLKKLAGVWVEEIDALAPGQYNEVVMSSGEKYSCSLLCDLMHLEGAQSLGTYAEDFYQGMPAVTRNCFGEGFAYYVGTRMSKEGLSFILDKAAADAAVESVGQETEGLEIVCRQTEDSRIYFVMNFENQERRMPLWLCHNRDLLSGEMVSEDTMLRKYDVYIIQIRNG